MLENFSSLLRHCAVNQSIVAKTFAYFPVFRLRAHFLVLELTAGFCHKVASLATVEVAMLLSLPIQIDLHSCTLCFNHIISITNKNSICNITNGYYIQHGDGWFYKCLTANAGYMFFTLLSYATWPLRRSLLRCSVEYHYVHLRE